MESVKYVRLLFLCKGAFGPGHINHTIGTATKVAIEGDSNPCLSELIHSVLELAWMGICHLAEHSFEPGGSGIRAELVRNRLSYFLNKLSVY